MSRKQKLIYSLIGLVVLLVVLFVVSKLVAWREQAIGDITTQTNEAGTITIGVMNPSLITDMSWTYEGETYSMEYPQRRVGQGHRCGVPRQSDGAERYDIGHQQSDREPGHPQCI